MPTENNNKKSIIRIKDIADKAEVSTRTVDRVLHNRGRVSEKAKEKVLRMYPFYKPGLDYFLK